MRCGRKVNNNLQKVSQKMFLRRPKGQRKPAKVSAVVACRRSTKTRKNVTQVVFCAGRMANKTKLQASVEFSLLRPNGQQKIARTSANFSLHYCGRKGNKHSQKSVELSLRWQKGQPKLLLCATILNNEGATLRPCPLLASLEVFAPCT